MHRIIALATSSVVLLGVTASSATAGARSAPVVPRPPVSAPSPLPPVDVRAVELRGPHAAASLRARGLDRAAATRAGLAIADLDELFDDPTVFAGPTGEIGYTEPALTAAETEGYHHGAVQDDLPAGTDVFDLHSRPDSTRTILLDLDGHTTSGTYWNSGYTGGAPIVSGAYDIDGDPASFSAEERARITSIWRLVAEDYAPFDVNVTTADPGAEALRRTGHDDPIYGIRIVVSSTDWYREVTGARAGGVAYLGSVTWDSDTPGFVFAANLGGGDAKAVGEAAAHEAGHAAGLRHDGVSGGSAYYAGHGDWAPIMGVGYYREITQWSRGEYTGADNLEDDLATIAARLGFAPDDHGDTADAATHLGPAGTDASPTTVQGLVAPGDVDVFTSDVSGGELTVALRPAPFTNLAARVSVLADGVPVAQATASPATDWSADLVVPVVAGRSTIEVRPVPHLGATTGFSAYASTGAYTLEITSTSTATTTTVPPTTTTTTTTTTVPPTTTTTTTVPPTTTTTTTTTTVPPTTTTTTTVPPTTTTTTTTTVPPTTTTTTTTTTTVPPTTTTTTTTVPRAGERPTPTPEPVGSGLAPISPTRLADTRTGLGGSRRLAAGTQMVLQVAGRAGIPTDATAAVLSVAAVRPDRPGYLTVHPCSSPRPLASMLNHGADETVANTTIATLDRLGRVCVFASADTEVVVDATGWVGPSGPHRLTLLAPERAMDTRATGRRVPAGATLVVALDQHVESTARAVAINVTAVNPTDGGYLTVYPCGQERPGTSSLNYSPGATRANNAVVGIGDGQRICVFTSATTDVLVDVTGSFGDEGLGYVAAVPRRVLDTRPGRPVAPRSSTAYAVPPSSTGSVVAASVNVTSVRHTDTGYLTAAACGVVPAASTSNHGRGAVVANGAIVGVTVDATSCVWSRTSGDVVVDLLGWWVS